MSDLHRQCRASDCKLEFHWCFSCGLPESPHDQANEQGYCSTGCAIEDMAHRIRELEAENDIMRQALAEISKRMFDADVVLGIMWDAAKKALEEK